jgi:hypothetical protein
VAWKEALRVDPARETVDKKIRLRQILENWAIFVTKIPPYADSV